MHSSLHNKAYKNTLLIANGHESYFHDLKGFSERLYYIDPYYQENNFLKDLNTFKSFIKKNNICIKETAIIYSSGLEDKIEIQKYLDKNFCIYGNSFSKYRYISDIKNLEKYTSSKSILFPKLSKEEKDKFILKHKYSSGGMGVGIKSKKGDYYFQEFISGPVYSVSFIAYSNHIKILGYNRQFSILNNDDYPYLHSGLMMVGKNFKYHILIKNFLYTIIKSERLKGFSSFDFIIKDAKIYFLEINARLSSSYRLYREKYGSSLLLNHTDCNKDKLISKNNKYHAYIILYAKSDILIDERILNTKDAIDKPRLGEKIFRNQPILTLKISSSSKNSLQNKIKTRINCAMEFIDCYNTDLNYE